MAKAKILFTDLEISPSLGYVWQKWEANVIAFKQEWEILSIAWKWEGKKVESLCRDDTPGADDKKLCLKLHALFNEADIICAHNGNSFDIKKARARFLFHGLPPTKELRTIDTKLVAKKYFSFNSNSLDDLGKHLGLGRKVKHEGFDLWLKCMGGCKKSWKKFKEYNEQDVVLLERLYQKMRPWMTAHPNMALMSGVEGCPNCGHEEFYSDGLRYTQKRKYRRLICKKCCARFPGALVK